MANKDVLKIALCQLKAQKKYPPEPTPMEKWAREARDRGGDIVVFPEMTMGVFSSKHPPSMLAIHYKDMKKNMEEIAQTFQIDILACLWEPSSTDKRAYNTALLINRRGKTLLLYRKLHLFDSLGLSESSFITPGNTLPPVIDYQGFKISVSICYDLRFPELYRYQAMEGAEISIVCSGWYEGILKETHLHTLLQCRAIENTMYVACANLCGENFCGRSCAFDPYGVKQGELGEEEDIILMDIYKDRLSKIRKKLPCLRHIRKDLFS